MSRSKEDSPHELRLSTIAKLAGESYHVVKRRILKEGKCKAKQIGTGREVRVDILDLRNADDLQGWYRAVAIHYGMFEEIPY